MITPKVLVDSGPLVALLVKNDSHHERAKALFAKVHAPLFTCESALSEACFLLSRAHRNAPQELLTLGQQGVFKIAYQFEGDLDRVNHLLAKYRNIPMSLADACLVRTAEQYNTPWILTFDSDFEQYRWQRSKRFRIL